MAISNFDLNDLFKALDLERRKRSLSWSGLTREINGLFREVPCPPIAMSTTTGLKGKSEVIANAALQMLVWLDRTPESFIAGHTCPKTGESLPWLEPHQILLVDTHAICTLLTPCVGNEN